MRKQRKLRYKLGDVFAIPLIPRSQINYTEYEKEWNPSSGDLCALVQVIMVGEYQEPLILCYQEKIEYDDNIIEKISLENFTPLFILQLAGGSGLSEGFLHKVGTLPIASTTPYQIYKKLNSNLVCTTCFGNAPGLQIPTNKKNILSDLVDEGKSYQFGILHNVLLKILCKIPIPYDIERFRKEWGIVKEHTVSSVFPEAKNNTQWVFDHARIDPSRHLGYTSTNYGVGKTK